MGANADDSCSLRPTVLLIIENLVNHDAGTEDWDFINSVCDGNTIAVGPSPEFLTNSRNDSSFTNEGELMAPERTIDGIVIWSGNIQREFLIEPSPFLDYFGEYLASYEDLISRFPRQQCLADQSNLVPLEILD